MKKLLFLIIYLLQTSLFVYAQRPASCGENLTDLVYAMKLNEGENAVCTSEDGLQYIAIVRSGKVIDWKIKDARGKQVAFKVLESKPMESSDNNGLMDAKAKRGSASSSTSPKIPVNIIICTIVNGNVTKNCRTVTKYP